MNAQVSKDHKQSLVVYEACGDREFLRYSNEVRDHVVGVKPDVSLPSTFS